MDDTRIEKAKAGDIRAFEELMEEHQKAIYNVAYRIVGNYDDASDVAQDAMIKIFKNLSYFEERSKFTTWMYRIVTNTALDFLKKKRRNKVISIDETISGEENDYGKQLASDEVTPQELVEQDERRQAVLKALYKLTPEHRAVLVLRDINGLSYDEIANVLMCSEGTVKSRINRARKSLRETLLKQKELFEDYIV